jgi:hypothetical protein
MAAPCTSGMVAVVGVTVSAGSFAVKVYNSGSAACTTTYSVVSTRYNCQLLQRFVFFSPYFIAFSRAGILGFELRFGSALVIIANSI